MATVLAALSLSAVAATAIEFNAVDWCQVRLSVMGRKFFHQWSGEIALCHIRRMNGELPESAKCFPDDIERSDTTTYCEPTTDPHVEVNFQQRLCRAELHSHDKIQRKCEDEYLPDIELGVPCGTVSTVGQLQDCIDFEAHGKNAIDFTRTVFGRVGYVADPVLRDCISNIFTVGQTYSRKVMQKIGEKCEIFVLAGKHGGPCPDPAAQKALNKARRVFAKGVLSLCQDYLDNHQIEFGPPCDTLGPNATASDYVDCLAAVANSVGQRGTQTVWANQ